MEVNEWVGKIYHGFYVSCIILCCYVGVPCFGVSLSALPAEQFVPEYNVPYCVFVAGHYLRKHGMLCMEMSLWFIHSPSVFFLNGISRDVGHES